MKAVLLLSALVLVLAVGAKAGWNDLPATGKVIDRRGDVLPIVYTKQRRPSAVGYVVTGDGTAQRTIEQPWPNKPWPVFADVVHSWIHPEQVRHRR